MDPLEKYLSDTYGLHLADFCIVTSTLSDGSRVAVACPIEWLASHVDFSALHPLNILRGVDAAKYLESLAGVPHGTPAKRPSVLRAWLELARGSSRDSEGIIAGSQSNAPISQPRKPVSAPGALDGWGKCHIVTSSARRSSRSVVM